MQNLIILGIDPGKSGGLAAIFSDYSLISMKADIEGPKDVQDFIIELRASEQPIYAFVEKAQAMPGQGVVSMFNYGVGFGEILGVLSSYNVPTTLVHPATWTKNILASQSRLEGKDRNVRAVQMLYPKLDLRKTERCKKPHIGLVDALLIANYGLKVRMGKI